MNWQQLLAKINWNVFWSVVAGILSSGLMSAVAQVWLTHRYAKKLEALKKDLSVELFERQTKFAWLHTERSKVLVRLYRLLSKVDKAFNDITRPLQITNDQLTAEGKKKAATSSTITSRMTYFWMTLWLRRFAQSKRNIEEYGLICLLTIQRQTPKHGWTLGRKWERLA